MAALSLVAALSPTSPDSLSIADFSPPVSFSRSASFPLRFHPQKRPTVMERRGRGNPSVCVSSSYTSANTHTRTVDPPTPSRTTAPATLYDVLQIPKTASETEIKSAYRRLARQYHPDVVPLQDKEESTRMFLQIHAAYVALSDPQSRARYDLQLSIQSFQAAGYKDRFSRMGGVKATQPSPIRTSTTYCSPRSPFSTGRGRSWETDQCW